MKTRQQASPQKENTSNTGENAVSFFFSVFIVLVILPMGWSCLGICVGFSFVFFLLLKSTFSVQAGLLSVEYMSELFVRIYVKQPPQYVRQTCTKFQTKCHNTCQKAEGISFFVFPNYPLIYRRLVQRSGIDWERLTAKYKDSDTQDLLHRTFYRYPDKGILHSSFYRDLVKEMLVIFLRDLHKRNLQNLTYLNANALKSHSSPFIYNHPTITGWWFGTFFIFPYIGNNHPNCLSYFSEGWLNHQPVLRMWQSPHGVGNGGLRPASGLQRAHGSDHPERHYPCGEALRLRGAAWDVSCGKNVGSWEMYVRFMGD